MEMTRQECLLVLKALQVDPPSNTKLSLDNLQKRLLRAIACTQGELKLPDSDVVDPLKLETWAEASKVTGSSLAEASKTLNIMEAAQNKARREQGKDVPTFEDPFIDLRQTVMALGLHWENGIRFVRIEDKDGIHGFTLRVGISAVLLNFDAYHFFRW